MSAPSVQTAFNELYHTIILSKFLKSVIEKLVDYRIFALLVVDQNKALKGVIFERHIMRQLRLSNTFNGLQVGSTIT